MVNLVGSLARRGVEVVQNRPAKVDENMQLSPWAIALLGVTFLGFILLGSSIEYTIKHLMGHLAIIESPENTTGQSYTPVSDVDSLSKKEVEAQGFLEVELEATAVTSTKPITSSIRRTGRHLKSIGGFKAKWRGLGIFIVYTLITTLISGFLNQLIMRAVPFGFVFSNIAAALLASRLHCAWTHKIITMPSDKKLWERRISCAKWKQLLAPTILSNLAFELSIGAIMRTFFLSMAAASTLTTKTNFPQWAAIVLGIVPGVVAAVCLPIFVILPAYAALVRKEASLLPEEDETIISFDRTFAGRLNQSGDILSYKEAWKSFDGEARRRVVKLYVKFFLITSALAIVMTHVIGLELLMVNGDKFVQNAVLMSEHIKQNSF